MMRLRRYLLEGLALAGPIGVTAWVLWWLFTRLDRILGEVIVTVLGRRVPGLGLLALVLVLLATGWVAERTIGRRATSAGEKLVNRIPIARPVYKGSRKLFQALTGQDVKIFKRPVLCEYPTPGIWSVAFITGPAPEAAHADVGEDGVSVFLPTAPNPMSGFLLVVPQSKIRPIDSSTEAAFTFVVSMGSVALGDAPNRGAADPALRERAPSPERKPDRGP